MLYPPLPRTGVDRRRQRSPFKNYRESSDTVYTRALSPGLDSTSFRFHLLYPNLRPQERPLASSGPRAHARVRPGLRALNRLPHPLSNPNAKGEEKGRLTQLPFMLPRYRPSRARSSRSTSSRSGTLTDRRRARPRAPTRTSSSARPPSSRIRSVAATTSSSSARPVSRRWFSRLCLRAGDGARATRDLVADTSVTLP